MSDASSARIFAPIVGGFGIGLPGWDRQPRPDRDLGVLGFLELAGTDPAVLHRRVDVGRLRRRASQAGETKRPVVGHLHRAGFLPELGERLVAQRQARLIEGIEVLEDQKRDRLAEIERGLADRAQEVARIERGNAGSHPHEIVCSHDRSWLQRSAERRQVEAGVDMGRIRGPEQQGVRSLRRPAGHVRSAKIGRIELGPGNFGDAVDASGACRGRVPALRSRQCLARGKSRLLGGRQACESESNAASGAGPDELASRNDAEPLVGSIHILALPQLFTWKYTCFFGMQTSAHKCGGVPRRHSHLRVGRLAQTSAVELGIHDLALESALDRGWSAKHMEWRAATYKVDPRFCVRLAILVAWAGAAVEE